MRKVDGHQSLPGLTLRLIASRYGLQDPRRQPTEPEELRHLFPASSLALGDTMKGKLGIAFDQHAWLSIALGAPTNELSNPLRLTRAIERTRLRQTTSAAMQENKS